jgi:fructoselysine-6-P-deglycase FrlB-like protein
MSTTLAIIQNAADDLIKSFEGLEIKKSRVAKFMKEECNLSVKFFTSHFAARNSSRTLEAPA